VKHNGRWLHVVHTDLIIYNIDIKNVYILM